MSEPAESSLHEVVERPELETPVMVLALEGWIDAGGAAARAAMSLLEGTSFSTVARFDTDLLLDHRARRPIVHIEAGLNKGLTWPSIEVLAFRDPGGSGVLLLTGAEPDARWRAFSQAVIDLALDLDVRLVVGLGAYPAAAPHTRPPLLAATATEQYLADAVAGVAASVDVPAGIHAVIEHLSADVGLPAVGIWAQVPHYAAALPYPAASLALIEKLNELCGMRFATGTLAEEATKARAKLDQLVTGSAEHVALLAELEAKADQETRVLDRSTRPLDLASAEELATEIEKYLRGQDS